MKRLLCILSCMNTGGAETFLMKILRTINRTEYMLDFCINVPEPNFYEEEIKALGGKIYRIPTKSADLSGYKKALAKVVKDNGYQYVLRITSSAMGFMDLAVAKKAGAKVCCARSSNSSDGGSLKAWLAHRIGRVLYSRFIDVMIAPSDLAAEYTFGKKAYRRGDVTILHNGLDLEVYRYNEAARNAIRAEFGIPEGARVIGHIGRFNTQKNHEYLIEIFCEIKKRDPGAILLLVGNGALEEEIREKVKAFDLTDSVIFTGVRSDVPSLLSVMDVFVFPSFFEGMPNVIIEAQATGLPCLISDTITREADITGLVEYRSLQSSAADWAEAALGKLGKERKDTRQCFIDAAYDIQSVTDEFVRTVFHE